MSKMKTYDVLMWLVTFVMIGTSIFRSWNLGYQHQTYLISGLCQIPMSYEAYHKKDRKLMMLNGFYLINSIIAVYRWRNNTNAPNKLGL